MPRTSPITDLHEAFIRSENERRMRAVADANRGDPRAVAMVSNRADVAWVPYGPDDADADSVRHLVASFGPFEPEYAAVRRGSALMDAFHRGVLRVTGLQRRDFLNRMLTQEVGTLAPGQCRESFWLNRKGRVEADMLIVETGEELLIDLDCFAASTARASLDRFLFSEDAAIEDRSASSMRFSMHGPRAGGLIESAGIVGAAALAPSFAIVGSIGGARVVVARRDQCAVPGFELFVDTMHGHAVWSALAAQSRPIGWEAYNTARIEGGTPLFRVDFGVESLPHETGVIASRVSFRKGCYLGQEIVARMESLGAPKQQVVAFRGLSDLAPVAGAQLRRPSEPMGTPIGAVTSSTTSPMIRSIIGFATVRSALADPGTRLSAHADGQTIEVEVLGRPASFLSTSGTAGVTMPTTGASDARGAVEGKGQA